MERATPETGAEGEAPGGCMKPAGDRSGGCGEGGRRQTGDPGVG